MTPMIESDEIIHRGYVWTRGVNRWEMTDRGDLWCLEIDRGYAYEHWKIIYIPIVGGIVTLESHAPLRAAMDAVANRLTRLYQGHGM